LQDRYRRGALVSIAELNRSFDGTSQASYGSADDRLPPQDVHAEQSVIGGMLLSKDAIADCVEGLKGVDFYRPAHELIYDAILNLYSRGEPADAITVSDELTKRGELTRVGGQAYLHQLISEVPTAANAGYYAEIVAERAVLRRLVDAGTKIVQMGYGQGGGDVVDIVNAAQAEIYAVADKRGGDDYAVLGDVLEATVDEIEHASGRSGEMTGVPTGFTDFDNLTNGLHPGQMIVVAARPAVGKALALDTPLPTPSGWTTMGAVAVGDFVLGADGRPAVVTRVTDVMTGRPCFEVEFSDGSVVVADAEHQWRVTLDMSEVLLTTVQILGHLCAGRVASICREPAAGAWSIDAATWKLSAIRPIDSVPVRCIEVDNEAHQYLAGDSMIPTHNSTWGLDIARSAAIRHKMTTVLFSLEMGRTEITMRLLSAEASIQLQNMRKGTMRDEDWTRLARTMGEVSDAPLFIDDSPNMSLMEIRAKCRRLKQRHNLRLVIIDYLQLMSSGKRVESRQQEVSEFSRALKLLAKELEVPVIAISQLNRGSEQRTDKRPQMSDLRESGCLTADVRVLRADTGAETSMGELYAEGATDVLVWALDDSLRYVQRHLTHVFPTGVKPVFRMTLASGKTIRATENHPLLTYDGWTPLGDLRMGSRVAVPRHVPAPEDLEDWQDDELVLLAHLLGDGFFDKGRRRATRLRVPVVLASGKPNPIARWLDGPDLVGIRHEKSVPEAIFHVSKGQIALFIREIWATGGTVTVKKNGQGGRIYYASASRRLADDLSRLLLRFGISTRTHVTMKPGCPNGYAIEISEVDDQRRFLQEIGVHGDRSVSAERLLEIVRVKSANASADVQLPVWDRVKEIVGEQGMPNRQLQPAMGTASGGPTMSLHTPSSPHTLSSPHTPSSGHTPSPGHTPSSGERLGRMAVALDDADLELMAVNDVLWDSVVSIEPDGVEEVYDATVLGNHNFVANGIAVHNSIEQDADMVILLHRESMYERESPREGEADLIVAKHRNGPTDTITVAFQGHYSRFTNMATNF
jgi:replicative DNA helicase